MTEDERAELKRLIELWHAAGLPAEGAPVRKPPDRLAHLNPHLREVLGAMSAEDADTLKEAIRFYRSANIVGKFLRWMAIIFAVTFGLVGGFAAFGDHVVSIWRSVTGASK